ncbi:MAG TPA: fibronectin type III domain-containing protein [Candidatus Binatia bacterium]|nr:fibronectin type III domain-containing protein [Candidatus Binatia bacterium]
MRYSLPSLLLTVSLTVTSLTARLADAATLTLTWTDNSSNEDGFNIERKTGTAGTYASIATVGANITSYSDSNLADSTTYCYRVNAFNSAGSSPYSPEVCGTTPAPPIATYRLAVSVQGSGTVTSNPAGINCGSTCSADFASGTTITLNAVAASGYTFSGWSGDADCLDGSVTMNAKKTCGATFSAIPVAPTSYTLNVSAVGTITAAGSGSGKIVSSPVGIDCGTKCSASFSTGTVVALQPVPSAGSVFTGWSGDGDCLDGSVTMNANKSCSGSFKLISYGLTVSRSGNGDGTVTSSAGGINCGTSCGAEFAQGTVVTLVATPAIDSVFSGWSGDADCLDGSVTMNASKSCTAGFTRRVVSNIGLYRPSTGAWYLVANSTGLWQGCNVDRCLGPFGTGTDVPLVGDWNGSGKLKLGLYDTAHKSWELDTNDDGTWQGCKQDTCFSFALNPASGESEIPLVGSWDGAPTSSVGVYKLATNPTTTKDRKSGGNLKSTGSPAGYWYFDRNRNGKWDGCSVDLCYGPFGAAGDIPVVGDWSGNGTAKIGVFTAQTGMWILDYNGNGAVDSCAIDKCFGPFGAAGDIPVVGDWSGNGTAKIGVFRAATGEWFLDMNGNGQWDGPSVDKYIRGFGQAGDLPVAGKW